MIHYTTGPELRSRIQRLAYDAQEGNAYIQYTYTDGDGRRTPEYAADHIKVQVYYARTSPTLNEQLEGSLRAIPGCLEVTRHENTPEMRSHVVGIFKRQES